MAADVDTDIDDYLRYLSERIRGLRAARGMTRKLLSHHSSISERYLAQLESGKANPSVTVLWRIANALGIDFHYLLAEEHHPQLLAPELWELLQTMSSAEQQETHALLSQRLRGRREHKRGIALIGLRGAGKTTIGGMTAEALSIPFIRLTEEIERLGGMRIGELFSLGGQKAYRRLERQAVERLLDVPGPIIVEVGGSLVSEPASFGLVRGAFITVWLRARPEDHMNRVIRQGDTRPMEEGSSEAMADLYRILSERESEYGKADHIIDTSGRTLDDCVKELKTLADEQLPLPRAHVAT